MRTMPAAVAAALALCAAPVARAQTTRVPYPPEFVAGPDIKSMNWSPDGRYLLVVREQRERFVFDRPPQSTASLYLWNQERRESKWILRSETATPEVHWVPRTNDAFVTLRTYRDDAPTEIWRVDARTASATRVPGVTRDVALSVSPAQPWAIVYGKDENGGFVRSLSPAGALGPRVALNEPAADFDAWSPDGQTAYFRHTLRPEDFPDPKTMHPLPPGAPPPPPDPDPVIPAFPAFTPSTGQLAMLNRVPKWYEAPPESLPFDVTFTHLRTTEIPREKSPQTAPWTPTVSPLWLVQKGDPIFKRLFIAADADMSFISPAGDAVAYQNREGAFVVPLVPVPDATLKEARRRDTIHQILQDGKQVALAAIMYAQDNKENLPAAGSGVNGLLAPYLMGGILSANGGFHYTFTGGPVMSIENPADTPLGYFDAPGGRVAAYVDGHVKWEPNP